MQSLDVSSNIIKQELDIRTLAALSSLRHLALAGNPVMLGMNPREQRAFVVDLMPGAIGKLFECTAGVCVWLTAKSVTTN